MIMWTLIIVGVLHGGGIEPWTPPLVVPGFHSAKTCSEAVPAILDARVKLIDPEGRFAVRLRKAAFACVPS